MRGSPLLGAAETLLLIPDLMNYWLTGREGLRVHQRHDDPAPGPRNGRMVPGSSEGTGSSLPPLRSYRLAGHRTRSAAPRGGRRDRRGPPVFAVASHDTASAVVAVPAKADDFAYISSGTWSLVGVETRGPVVTQEAIEANFTNEGGFGEQHALPQERDGALAPPGVPQAVGAEKATSTLTRSWPASRRKRHPARWSTPTIPRS